MFLRFREDNTVRTIDLNRVIHISRTAAWVNKDGFSVYLEYGGEEYAVVARGLTLEQSKTLEERICTLWARRDDMSIFEITPETHPQKVQDENISS